MIEPGAPATPPATPSTVSSDLGRIIAHWAAQRPERTAIRFDGRDITWRELADRIDAAAAALTGLGARHGDRIAYLGLNHPLIIVLLFACCRIGAMLAPLNFRLTPAEHARQLADSTPLVLLHEAAFDEHLDAAAHRSVLPPRLSAETFWLGTSGIDSGARTITRSPTSAAPRYGTLYDDALLVYTSGTSGQPKGVVLTQNALLFNCINSIHAHDLTGSDHGLIVLPMFHVGGLNIMALPLLYVGARITLHPRFDPTRLLADIAALRPTLTLLVPATLAAAIAEPAWAQTDLSSLRMINTGSSVVPSSLIQAWHQRGIPVGQVYGATETCPIAICLRAEDAMRKAGSTGLPAMHCEASLRDEEGLLVADGDVGEIHIRGPNVMRCYYGQPEATAAAFRDDWYRTGDLARRDADGYYWVVGRCKDMIISGGENIYPAELEAILADCPAIAEAAVVGLPDARWGEVPVAVVIRRNAIDIDEASVIALFDDKLARYKHPKRVLFVADMPRTALGKVIKAELAASLAGALGG